MSRYKARELAFKSIFELGFKMDEGCDPVIEAALLSEEAAGIGDERGYYERVVRGVSHHAAEIDDAIDKHSIGWSKKRISRVARAVLRLSVFEILFMDDISTGVSINEAVELAKKYADPDCASFVNGLLGGFVRTSSPEEEEGAKMESGSEAVEIDVEAADSEPLAFDAMDETAADDKEEKQ